MRKILIMLIAFTFAALLCAVEEPIAQPQQVSTKTTEATILTGKVISVISADTAKGITKSSINIVDDTGKTVEVLVNPATKIYDISMLKIGLNEIKKDDKVSLNVTTTKENSLEATSINVIE